MPKVPNIYEIVRCLPTRLHPEAGQSGLSLEAQRAAVSTFTQTAYLVGKFVEVESGKQNQRPQLATTVALAKVSGATLLIAKLDRLSRNAGFIFQLRDAGVAFVATCPMLIPLP